jgi:hypothetical protein
MSTEAHNIMLARRCEILPVAVRRAIKAFSSEAELGLRPSWMMANLCRISRNAATTGRPETIERKASSEVPPSFFRATKHEQMM